jgi:hypothetical protein
MIQIISIFILGIVSCGFCGITGYVAGYWKGFYKGHRVLMRGLLGTKGLPK